jgi:hypothetical protein
MAANFTLVPTKVIPLPAKWNNKISNTETMKKQYLRLAIVPEERFKLVFEKMSDANYLTLKNHVDACYGEYDNFSWTSVPSYIDTNRDGVADGSSMTGRWEEGSLSEPEVNAYDMGDIFIIFVKDI